MTTSPKPTLVLLGGIWHSPLTYTPLTSALQRLGYDVHVPFLPSCTGARPPTASLAEDTQLVRRYVELLADQGRSIIMLLHSYGGVVASNALSGLDRPSRAAAGLPGGVVHFVGFAAHFHPVGYAPMDLVRDMGHADLIPLAIAIADDGACMATDPRVSLFEGVSDADAAGLVRTLSWAPLGCLTDRPVAAAWTAVPCTYVLTTRDLTLPEGYQRRIVEKMVAAGGKVEVVELDTGHSPYVTRRDEVVRIIEDVVEKVMLIEN